MKSRNALLGVVVSCGVAALFSGAAEAAITGTFAVGPDGSFANLGWGSETTIGGTTTFFYSDLFNTDTATFSGNTLTITDVVHNVGPETGADGFEMTFSQPGGFSGLTLGSGNFDPSLTFSLTGGKIKADWLGEEGKATTFTTTFSDAVATKVPEPSMLTMIGVALIGAGFIIRRRRSESL